MTVLIGKKFSSVHSSLFTGSFTVTTPTETIISATKLPTSEPETPQLSFTLAAGDFPVFSPVTPTSVKYTVEMIAVTYHTVGTAQTINYRIKKNTVSQTTGTRSNTNAQYATHYYYLYDVTVGDLVEMALWDTASDQVDLKYKTYWVHPTDFYWHAPQLVSNAILTVTSCPTLTSGGSPAKSSTGAWNTRLDALTVGVSIDGSNSPRTFSSMYILTTKGLGALSYGGSSGGGVYNHATNNPYYVANYLPLTISYRKLNIKPL